MPASPRELLDALPTPAVTLDTHNRIVNANTPLGKLIGRSTAELIGLAIEVVLADTRHLRPQDPDTQKHSYETHAITFDGDHVPVMVSVSTLTSSISAAAAQLVTITDLSDVKQAAAEIAHLSDAVIDSALKLQDDNEELERRVRRRTQELHDANLAAITMLAVASEARDSDTGAHVRRIQFYSSALARRLGQSDQAAEAIGISAVLHDVGKITVPDSILKKPGPLTDDERSRMQQHTTAGENILAKTSFFDMARSIARSHHERWDGRGYPDRLVQSQTPLPARIVHVVDVFDALSTPRVYKDAWPPARVVAQIRSGAGTDFDPDIVDAFLKMEADDELPHLAELAATHAASDPLSSSMK